MRVNAGVNAAIVSAKTKRESFSLYQGQKE